MEVVTIMFKEALKRSWEKDRRRPGRADDGTDGIAVDKFFSDAGREANLDVAAAEFTSLVRSASRTGMICP